MNTFVTVFTAYYPHELAVIRGRLESEGIDCFVKDEMIAQINPFYSNAVGGVKLQVKESDVELALEIIKEGGYPMDERPKASPFYTKVDNFSAKIPFLNKLDYEIRFLVMAGIVISMVVCIVLLLIAFSYE
jgi:hypothetical protein